MLYSKWDWNDYMEVKREEAAAEFAEHERQYQEQIRQYQEQNRRLEEEIRRLRNGGVSG
jgi:cell division protein FtsB